MDNTARGITGSLIFAFGGVMIMLVLLTSGTISSNSGIPPQLTLILSFFGFFAIGMGLWVIQDKR